MGRDQRVGTDQGPGIDLTSTNMFYFKMLEVIISQSYLRFTKKIVIQSLSQTHIILSVFNRFELPADTDRPPNSRNQHRFNKSGERRVHSMQILVHKTRKLDPAFIK